jgi:hypothetical protein
VYTLICIGLLIGAPSFIFFGWLSDRIGAKWIMMAGLFLAALCYRPMFSSLLEAGNPALASAMRSAPVIVHADPNNDACTFSITASLVSAHPDHAKPCVKAKKFLVGSGINFEYGNPIAGQTVAMTVKGQTINGFEPAAYRSALTAAGYPSKADPAQVSSGYIVFLLVLMTVMVAMVYGPVAAYLVQLFPPSIRYTALSFPYHIGAGIFGGFLPFFATYLSLSGGNVFAGLWYPVVITLVTGIIGCILLPNTKSAAQDA